MGSCQSATDQVQKPKPLPAENKFKTIEKNVFNIPQFNKLDVCSSNGKILEYITNNLGTKNNFLEIDVSKYLTDGKYTDPEFTADNESLGPQPMGQNIEWKRPSQFMKGQYKVFEGKIQPLDIKQGKLGDCYLLSSIAALSEHPFTIKRIFQTTQQSTYGIYGIWLFIDGVWKCIVIDDLFPIHGGKPVFSRNHENQLWVMLIEKAFAKVFGSYQAIESGLTGIALSTITGAPYEYICKDSNNKPDPTANWEFIVKHMSQNHFIVGSTENNDRNGYLGLVSTHAYTILDAQQVHIATKKGKKRQRILKLENPWGKYEWKGRWSQYSDVWSEELREQLHFEKADDGVFWINIQDFSQNFGQICVCKFNKNHICTSLPLTFPTQQQSSVKGIFISTNIRTEGYLSIIQKDHRFFSKQSSYQYSLVRIIVLQFDKVTKSLNKYLTDLMDCDHDATVEITFDPGDYYVVLQMDWKCTHTRDVTIQYYGQHPIQIVEDKQIRDINGLFNQIVILHEKHTQKQRIYQYAKDNKIVRITGSIAGYVYYHYSNKSKTNNYLCENVVLKERKFIQVFGESSEEKEEFTVKIYPQEERIVKLKVSKEGNGFYLFSTKIQFYIVQKYTLQKLRELADKKPTKVKTREIENKPIDVRIKTYNYSGGIVLLYQNKMDKYAYIQQITFQLDNLQLENETLGRNSKLEIQLEPNSEKMLSFVVKSPGKQVVFKTKMSFYLNSPEFKF